ncbi:hypothetical protein EYF80_065935 [Liparis tanakae]|uniref:Uncharacterized protein n=1 Tax=Liparis tanakae TaxID=230148 RepID=A0A4Z2E6G7_9TELE|nr:hypothetical protein EYF80_065935 [Liparis tanakae]
MGRRRKRGGGGGREEEEEEERTGRRSSACQARSRAHEAPALSAPALRRRSRIDPETEACEADAAEAQRQARPPGRGRRKQEDLLLEGKHRITEAPPPDPRGGHDHLHPVVVVVVKNKDNLMGNR